MHALKRNKKLEVNYFPAEKSFDATKLKGKYDIIMLGNHNSATPDELIGIKELDTLVIAIFYPPIVVVTCALDIELKFLSVSCTPPLTMTLDSV